MTRSTNSRNASRDAMTSRQRWILALASLASFMVALDSLIVSTALSTFHRELHATLGSLVWIVNSYNLTLAVLLLTGAALGDRFGRRRTFVAGLGLFALASAACALSPDLGALIAARALQGVGAALMMPMALTQLSAAFAPEQRGRALGFFLAATGLGTVLGPFVGGVLAERLAWPWIFWINVPIGLIGMVLVHIRLDESHGPNKSFDLGGVALVTAAAFGLVWGLQRGNVAGWGSVEVIGSFVLAAVGVVAFVAWERRAPTPLLSMRLFRNRAFSLANATMFLLYAQIYGLTFMLAQFLQDAQGHGPLGAGLRLMPLTVHILVLGPIAGALADRFGERALIVGGLFLQTITTAIVALIVSPDLGYLSLIVPLVIGGCGSTLAIPATQKAVMGAVGRQEIGQASGVANSLRYLGGVFGIAMLGAVFASSGGYGSPHEFTRGFVPALAVIAAFSLLGAIAGLGLPGRGKGSTTPAVALATRANVDAVVNRPSND